MLAVVPAAWIDQSIRVSLKDTHPTVTGAAVCRKTTRLPHLCAPGKPGKWRQTESAR
jgi:hypothetical protein